MAQKTKARKHTRNHVMKLFLKLIDKLSVWYYYRGKRWMILLVLLMPSCVSLKRLEKEKADMYAEGNLNMARMCLDSLNTVEKTEDLYWIKNDLRSILIQGK